MTDQVQATRREQETQVQDLTPDDLERVTGGSDYANVVFVGGSRRFAAGTDNLVATKP